MHKYTVAELLRPLEERFKLSWLVDAGERNTSRQLSWGNHPKAVGYLNSIQPNYIQVIGQVEMAYMQGLATNACQEFLHTLFAADSFAFIIVENLPVTDMLKSMAAQHQIALLTTPLPGNELITELRYVLSGILAEKQILHGVFMEVISVGVLLMGDSSIGKSELALELVSRGHRLIADDAPEFARITPDIVSGHAPTLLQDLLEVRGLGILNIRQMYGDGAIKHSKYLRLIIKLITGHTQDIIRIGSMHSTCKVLGVDISEITLPVAPGRNLAVMVEAAVLDYLLKLRGYNAEHELIERQHQRLQKK